MTKLEIELRAKKDYNNIIGSGESKEDLKKYLEGLAYYAECLRKQLKKDEL